MGPSGKRNHFIVLEAQQAYALAHRHAQCQLGQGDTSPAPPPSRKVHRSPFFYKSLLV